MNSNWAKLFLKSRRVHFGKGVCFHGVPFIRAVKGAQIILGERCVLNSSFLSNMLGLYCRSIIVARCPDSYVRIGKNVGISGVTIYARKGITIGDNTLIGANTKIIDNDFHSLDLNERRAEMERGTSDSSTIASREVEIGNDCFIGCNALILKGTKLGDGCVVGAGAVVSGVFEPRSLIAGNPGKVIRKL